MTPAKPRTVAVSKLRPFLACFALGGRFGLPCASLPPPVVLRAEVFAIQATSDGGGSAPGLSDPRAQLHISTRRRMHASIPLKVGEAQCVKNLHLPRLYGLLIKTWRSRTTIVEVRRFGRVQRKCGVFRRFSDSPSGFGDEGTKPDLFRHRGGFTAASQH